MTTNKQRAGGNQPAKSTKITFTHEHVEIERVLASCVHDLLLQTPLIAFCDLRARVRDWATRGQLLTALGALMQADVIHVTDSIAGPQISLRQERQ